MTDPSSRWFRANLWVHRWASLVATLPFLVLCLTGTVLVFHEEIDVLLGDVPQSTAAGDPRIDESVETLRASHPEERILSVGVDPERHPGVLLGVVAPPNETGFDHAKLVFLELASGRILGDSDPRKTFTGFLLELHAEWFLGPVGRLIGGLIGLLVVASLLSGVVIYAPFMRKLLFGMVRRGRGARLVQLDLHNFFGVVVLGWALVVSVTGFLLGLGSIALGAWQYTDLAAVRYDYENVEPVDRLAPPIGVARAIAAATSGSDWNANSVFFPDTDFSTKRHYAVLLTGPEGLDARMLRVVLVDAEHGHVARTLELPGYLKTILVSEPLHFGDYGGLALKLLWTACTWLTLFVTANGAWLFFHRRRKRPQASPVPAFEAEAA